MHIIKQTEVPEYKNVNIEPSCRSLFIFPFYWIIIGGLHVGPALYFCHWAVWYGATLFLKMYTFKSQCNLNVCKHIYICFNTELWRLETLNTISASYSEVSVWVAVVFCTSVLALFFFLLPCMHWPPPHLPHRLIQSTLKLRNSNNSICISRTPWPSTDDTFYHLLSLDLIKDWNTSHRT